MKDSGVPWIGEIPKDWSIRQASQIFAATKHPNNGLQENNLLSLSYGRIVRKSIETSFGLLPESFEGYNIIDKDTIVLRLTDLQNDQKSLRVGIATEKGIITSAYLSLRCITNDTPKYLYYLLHCFDIVKGFYGMGGGIRQGLTWDGVKNLRFYLPNQAEQQRIADFLDAKCAEIDTILEQTRESIDEYKKLKQSVITEAVTKGIRINRLVKKSGLEWCAEPPIEWSLIRIGLFLRDKSDYSSTGEETPLSVTQDRGIIYSSEANVANPSQSTIGWKRVSVNDLVFNKYKAHSGVFFVSPFDGIVTFNYNVYECRNMSIPRYLEYLFKSPGCISEFRKKMKGVGDSISPLYTRDLFSIVVPLPPVQEQQEIAAYLDEKCAAIDSLIASKESLITELEAYKKSIIYEYVTGKKEVPAV